MLLRNTTLKNKSRTAASNAFSGLLTQQKKSPTSQVKGVGGCVTSKDSYFYSGHIASSTANEAVTSESV